MTSIFKKVENIGIRQDVQILKHCFCQFKGIRQTLSSK